MEGKGRGRVGRKWNVFDSSNRNVGISRSITIVTGIVFVKQEG